MKTTLDPTALALLALFNLSEGAEEFIQLIQSEWTVQYYDSTCGGVEDIEISAVPNVVQPIVRCKVILKSGRTMEMYFYLHKPHDGKLTLTEYDRCNVQRCSTDPTIYRNVQHHS